MSRLGGSDQQSEAKTSKPDLGTWASEDEEERSESEDEMDEEDMRKWLIDLLLEARDHHEEKVRWKKQEKGFSRQVSNLMEALEALGS